MSTYTNILVGFDLSTESKQVAQTTAAMAKQFGANVVCLHVIDPATIVRDAESISFVAPGGGVPVPVAPQITKEQQDVAIQRARETLNQLCKAQGLEKAETEVHVGTDPKAVIRDMAKKYGVDLIIVGSHGRHGLSLLLGGSTARSVLSDSPSDVLAVRVKERNDTS